jgi:hypothetical protein
MSPRTSSASGPWPYRVAVGVAAGVVLVRSVLLALDGVERLQGLSLTDPVWPALAVLLALLVGPYVSEVQAAGARVVRQAPPPADSSGELAELASATLDEQPTLSPDEQAELAASRYLGTQLAVAGAQVLYPELAPLRLHLHVPDDSGRLVPVLEYDDAATAWARGWDPGVGVVGRAFSRRRVQVSRAPALQAELSQVPDKPDEAFRDLSLVLAVPLLNLGGRPVGVLSAAGSGPEPLGPEGGADEADLRLALEALASGLARVLVDLAAWDTDDAAGAVA